MNDNLITPNLIAFKDLIFPYLAVAKKATQDMKDKVSDYAMLLLQAPQTADSEDAQTLDSFMKIIKLMQAHCEHLSDIVALIGTPKHVERYFNNVNGELVEVSREEYAGKDIPDDDDTAQDLPE